VKDFREFLLRGSVVDLAVGIVIGVAFGTLVTAFVTAFISPLVALITGQASIESLTFSLESAHFPYGLFLEAVLTFVLTALVIFYVVVKPINALRERQRRGEAVDPTSKPCPECLSEIPVGARRCAFCTSEQPTAA